MTRVTDSRGGNNTTSFQSPHYTEQLFLPSTYTGGIDVAKADFSLETVISTLYRYRWLIAIVSMATFGLALVLTFTSKIELTYRSQAMVSVGRYIPPILGPTGRLLRETTNERSYVADQLPLLTSYTIAELVMKDNPDIRNYVEYGVLPAPGSEEANTAENSSDYYDKLVNSEVVKRIDSETSDPKSKAEIGKNSEISLASLQAYLDLINYDHVRNTSMVAITAEAVRPGFAAKIANVHSKMFIALVRAKLLDNARVNLEFLQKRKIEAKEKAEETRKTLIKYAEDNNILVGTEFDESGKGNLLAYEYAKLSERLTTVTQSRSKAESEYRALQSSGSAGGRLYNGYQDRGIAIKLANLKAEIQSLKKSGFGSTNPYVKEITRQANLYEEMIKTDRKNEVKNKEVSMRALRDQERLMLEAMQDLKERSQRESKTKMRYSILAQEDKAAQELLEELSERLEEVYIHLNGNQSHVRMIDKARAPKFSRSEVDYLNLMLGAILGPFMGIALAFAFDMMDNTVRTVSDLQRILNVPMLGIIPRFSLDLEEMIASSFQALPEGEGEGDYAPSDFQEGDNLPGLENMSAGIDTDQSPSVLVGGPSLAGAWSTHVREKLDLPANADNAGTVIGQKPSAADTGTTDSSDLPSTTSAGGGFDTIVGQQISQDAIDSEGGNSGGTTIITSSSLVLVSAPHSAESEAFRNVRTCVTYGCTENPPKLVLVTSGQKSDGKTTVACNLAISLAQVSERTLLIDSDLRLPTIHKNFSLSRLTPGLSDYLQGNRDYGEVIFETPIPNLCLMLAGGPCPNPTELVGSKRMSELLELLTDEFDHIIIDSPPVTRVADAMLLSRLVEGVVLVVRSGKTPEPVAENALQRLKQMDANILGTVLNDVMAVPGYRDAEYYYLSESYYGPESYEIAEDDVTEESPAAPV